MPTTKPDTETGWTDLCHAIDEMNKQPDISANDSPRLRELCRVTAMEIKAVGGVGAATCLEMIGYIRELERSRVGEDDYVAWCRYTYNSEGGIQSIVTCDSDAKGAFKVYRTSPSDFEQLIRLRKSASNALSFLEPILAGIQSEPQPRDGILSIVESFSDGSYWNHATLNLEDLRDAVAALREALGESK